MISIERYSIVYQEAWNQFIESSKNGTFLFLRNYMDYHSDRFTDHSLIVFKDSQLIAVLPANEQDGHIVSHGGLTFGGLIMNNNLKLVQTLEIFEKIVAYYSDKGCISITYKALPKIFHKYPSEEDLYALFRIKAQLVRRDVSSVVKLHEAIRFSESKRQSVTKCIKQGIEIKESNNFTDFWDLLTEILEKFKTLPVHSLSEIMDLKNRFPSNIKLYEAIEKDELLAGIVIYDYGQVVHTQYMANSVRGRTIGALDFINHTLINSTYADRKYYSFGISTEQNGSILNQGLVQQKEMMGGRSIAYDFYKIEL